MASSRPYPNLTAKQMSDAFAQQYYNIMENSPEQLYQFYKDSSKVARPENNGTISITTTKDRIKVKLLALRNLWGPLHMETVDAQELSGNNISVVVTGNFNQEGSQRKKFVQKFFLAPQAEGGYFIETDVLNII